MNRYKVGPVSELTKSGVESGPPYFSHIAYFFSLFSAT